MKLPPEILGPIVNQQAMAHDLRPEVVMCVIIQESRCDPYANRYELHIHEALIPKKRNELAGWSPDADYDDQEIEPTLATEKSNRAHSWGLMQVLGETARWCAKFKQPFLPALSDPTLGVDVGCRVLSYYLGRAGGDYAKALGSYNGSGKPYADQVLKRIKDGEHVKYLQGK